MNTLATISSNFCHGIACNKLRNAQVTAVGFGIVKRRVMSCHVMCEQRDLPEVIGRAHVVAVAELSANQQMCYRPMPCYRIGQAVSHALVSP
jgi:hypothetical protein